MGYYRKIAPLRTKDPNLATAPSAKLSGKFGALWNTSLLSHSCERNHGVSSPLRLIASLHLSSVAASVSFHLDALNMFRLGFSCLSTCSHATRETEKASRLALRQGERDPMRRYSALLKAYPAPYPEQTCDTRIRSRGGILSVCNRGL